MFILPYFIEKGKENVKKGGVTEQEFFKKSGSK